MDLKEADILGDAISMHWYYRAKASAIIQLLGSRKFSTILDVGAGSGFFSKYLLDNTAAQEAWCIDVSYICDFDAFQNQKPIHFRQSIEQIDADLVLLMDVLEHVEDDVGFLQNYISKVQRGSLFLISVPAFQFLWSSHDVFLEHKRRYTLTQLEMVIQKSGLQLLYSRYYFGLVLPLAVITRLADRLFWPNSKMGKKSQLTRHSRIVNEALAAVCRAELPLLFINRYAGLTAFCLAELP